MMPHQGRSSADHSRPHRLLTITGIAVVVVAVLAHLGGAKLTHVGLGAALGKPGGGALVLGLLVLGILKVLLLVVVARTGRFAPMSQTHSGITRGKTIHGARSYDRLVALLTLGRGRALRERTIALARIAPGDHVLDVGCGTGEITMRAKARTGPTGSVTGIDPAPEMVAEARQKAARAGLDIDYHVAAVEALPVAAASFDVVTSSLMMHHLPQELKPRAVAEIRRVLKPGGRLVIVDFKQPSSLLGRLAPVWLLHRSAAVHGVQELPALLKEADFGAIEIEDTGVAYLGCVHARVDG
jgi:demethylmenaquinone methyltransferase/2-methoxy-6-polyprenyl-1,4-benzoquinol methylase/phosphoethanolamine N-methyltransferase